MGIQVGAKVDRVNGRQLSYRDFVDRYLKKNIPVVLTDLMNGWQACSDWVSDDGSPDLCFLAEHFGNSIVQVADCCKKDFTDQKGVKMSVSEYTDYCFGISMNKYQEVANNNDGTESLLYLKDWHFVKEYPDYVAYTTPPLFMDDWLNIYLESYCLHCGSDIAQDKSEINCADYRFVYMGVKGTWTPLHADVFRSYSWSANVCGKKLWLFLPPSQCHLIFDRYHKTSVYDVHGDISEKNFPGFNKAVWWECIQEQNEIIFVPSGWYHQVHNLVPSRKRQDMTEDDRILHRIIKEDTISINHNWFNAYNLSWVWNLLVKDYIEAKEYIEDIRGICDDFESICQRNLAANTGMNCFDFFTFIVRFALANMTVLRDLMHEEFPHLRSISYYVISNMGAMHSVASNMDSVDTFPEESSSNCSQESRFAVFDARGIMEDPNFHVLCSDLGIILKAMCEEHQDYNVEHMPCRTDLSKLSDFRIHNPAELVKMIENAFPERFIICEHKSQAV